MEEEPLVFSPSRVSQISPSTPVSSLKVVTLSFRLCSGITDLDWVPPAQVTSSMGSHTAVPSVGLGCQGVGPGPLGFGAC